MAKEDRIFTRRDFVRGTMGAALGASVIGSSDDTWAADTAQKSRVALVRDAKAKNEAGDIDLSVVKKMLDETLTTLTGQKTPKEAWMSLLKPDDVIGYVPTPHLNPTNQEVVDVLCASLKDAGFAEENNRYAQAKRNSKHRETMKTVKGCTALIAVPALKAHWLTGIGTVLKNYIMYSGKPDSYHGEMNKNLGEIWNLPDVKGKTKLVLVDAIRPLCDKGPQPDPRYLWDYKGLLAGTDPVAMERVCLEIIMKKREAMRGEPWPLSPPPICVEAADKEFKLGTSDLSKVEIAHRGWGEELLLTV